MPSYEVEQDGGNPNGMLELTCSLRRNPSVICEENRVGRNLLLRSWSEPAASEWWIRDWKKKLATRLA